MKERRRRSRGRGAGNGSERKTGNKPRGRERREAQRDDEKAPKGKGRRKGSRGRTKLPAKRRKEIFDVIFCPILIFFGIRGENNAGLKPGLG